MKIQDVIAALQCLVGETIHTVDKLNRHIFLDVVAVEYLPPDERDHSDTDVIIRHELENYRRPWGLVFASAAVKTFERQRGLVIINDKIHIVWAESSW